MTHSGYIDWHAVMRTKPWVPVREGQTFVYAFWLVDYGQNRQDQGLSLFKLEGSHPDWFIHADSADQVLVAQCPPGVSFSPNGTVVFVDDEMQFLTRPLLAAVKLGSANVVYRSPEATAYWCCEHAHLERRGQRLLRELSMLYLRQPEIITFIDLHPMKQGSPEAALGSATALPASG